VLGLLAPGWLLAFATLSLPVALHLWSPRGGRPIRVGSIRLLLGAPPATRRSWAVRDPVLLLVRCAVLALLVLALAGPYWTPRSSSRRWALVADDVAARNTLVDSLTRAGLVVVPPDRGPGDRPQNLWTALDAAARAVPPGTHFDVFGPQLVRYFRGARPAIAARVEWHTRAPAPSADTGPAPRPPARFVAVYAAATRAEDVRYVRAAIQAAGVATGIPALVTVGADSPGIATAPADWIIWLSARPVPGSVLARVRSGATLLTDAGSQPWSERRSRILLVDRPSDAWLLRRSAEVDSAAPLWTDGTGRAVLTLAREGRGWHYRFHGRFHPAWSEFVLRAAFPEAMARLWIGPDSIDSRRDDRPIALGQLLPALDSVARATATLPTSGRSLFLPTWLLGLALFALERRFAAQPRRHPV
jgi:aerotolerance regulator-like protein